MVPVVHWRLGMPVQVATSVMVAANCTLIHGSIILQNAVIPAISAATSTANRAASADLFLVVFLVCGVIVTTVMDATLAVRLIVAVGVIQSTVVVTHVMVAVLSVWGHLSKQRFQKGTDR